MQCAREENRFLLWMKMPYTVAIRRTYLRMFWDLSSINDDAQSEYFLRADSVDFVFRPRIHGQYGCAVAAIRLFRWIVNGTSTYLGDAHNSETEERKREKVVCCIQILNLLLRRSSCGPSKQPGHIVECVHWPHSAHTERAYDLTHKK